MTADYLFDICGMLAIGSPTLLVLSLGSAMLLGIAISEQTTARLTQAAVGLGLLGILSVLCMMLLTGERYLPLEFGNWVSLEQEHFHFSVKFVFDRLSVPFTILCYVLCGTVGAFAKVYLHREGGYPRFFLFYSLFLLGMIMSSLAGTIETLFFGWELVGLSSALLIAYFHQRMAPVQNGMRVWTVYRFADAAFLMAALALHHLTGGGDFEAIMDTGMWPDGTTDIGSAPAWAVGLLLLVAAAGKSGMVPFSGWLPRAMEGPTPSSAVFYGALSIHLGAYLLLRLSPALGESLVWRGAVIGCGLLSAIFGALTTRVQTDVKSALAYASLTQLGIIVMEIGLGLHYLALVHIFGHALLRTLQLLRAPSLLQDYLSLENALGGPLYTTGDLANVAVEPRRSSSYRFCFHRGYLDAMLENVCVRPFMQFFQWAQRQETRWEKFWEPVERTLERGPTAPASRDQSLGQLEHVDSPATLSIGGTRDA